MEVASIKSNQFKAFYYETIGPNEAQLTWYPMGRPVLILWVKGQGQDVELRSPWNEASKGPHEGFEGKPDGKFGSCHESLLSCYN